MSTYSEMKEIPEKFKLHRDKLVNLFKEYKLKSVGDFRKIYKTDKKFQLEFKEILKDMTIENGGKLSLTTIGIIIGSALGGAGIAAMGGAIGVSLAMVLGISGFIAGSKFDDTKLLSDEKNISVTLPNELVKRLEQDSDKIGCSVDELLSTLIRQVYNIDAI
jgi:hypothetical protein